MMKTQISSSWLITSKLSRKAGDFRQAFNAVLNATKLNDQLAPIEQARLYWTEGQHRKALKSLESAISSNTFSVSSLTSASISSRELENMSLELQPQSYAKARVSLNNTIGRSEVITDYVINHL